MAFNQYLPGASRTMRGSYQIHSRFLPGLHFYVPLRSNPVQNPALTDFVWPELGPNRFVARGLGNLTLGSQGMDAYGYAWRNIGEPASVDRLQLAGSHAMPFTGPFSVMGWVQPFRTPGIGDGNGPAVACIKLLSGTNVNVALLINTDSRVYFQFTVGGSYKQVSCPGVFPGANNNGPWRHLAGVYDGAKITVYVDGVPRASLAASGTPDDGGTIVNCPFFVGRDGILGISHGGQYREVAGWNLRALTAADVSFAYQNQSLMHDASYTIWPLSQIFTTGAGITPVNPGTDPPLPPFGSGNGIGTSGGGAYQHLEGDLVFGNGETQIPQ